VDLPGTAYPKIANKDAISIEIPTSLPLADGWQLSIAYESDLAEAMEHSYMNPDPFQAWLDLEMLVLPLTLRTRKSGERFQPLGMGGHSLKVSDLMVNLKLPSRARSTWPLVCSGNDILWIPGYRQSHLGRLRPGSHYIVHLVLSRQSGT
jgi:tRNA(Ile)-lysidine synthase